MVAWTYPLHNFIEVRTVNTCGINWSLNFWTLGINRIWSCNMPSSGDVLTVDYSPGCPPLFTLMGLDFPPATWGNNHENSIKQVYRLAYIPRLQMLFSGGCTIWSQTNRNCRNKCKTQQQQQNCLKTISIDNLLFINCPSNLFLYKQNIILLICSGHIKMHWYWYRVSWNFTSIYHGNTFTVC